MRERRVLAESGPCMAALNALGPRELLGSALATSNDRSASRWIAHDFDSRHDVRVLSWFEWSAIVP